MSQVLVVAEHLDGKLNFAATAKTVSAARALSPDKLDVIVLADAPDAIAAEVEQYLASFGDDGGTADGDGSGTTGTDGPSSTDGPNTPGDGFGTADGGTSTGGGTGTGDADGPAGGAPTAG